MFLKASNDRSDSLSIFQNRLLLAVILNKTTRIFITPQQQIGGADHASHFSRIGDSAGSSCTHCAKKLETYGLRCGMKASPHQLRHSCATLLLNAGAPVLSVQMILGHKQIDTTLGYARLYDGTLAADYYSAMNKIERQFALPEDSVKEPAKIGELIALADALRNGSLNPAQTEIVRALREGLGLLEGQAMEDVKVQEKLDVVEAFAN